MHLLLVLLGVHTVLLGFVCMFAGWMSLISPGENESAELRAEVKSAREKGWLHAELYVLRWQQRFGSASRVIGNWQQRSVARRLIYVGAGFLAIAAVIAYDLNVFS